MDSLQNTIKDLKSAVEDEKNFGYSLYFCWNNLIYKMNLLKFFLRRRNATYENDI